MFVCRGFDAKSLTNPLFFGLLFFSTTQLATADTADTVDTVVAMTSTAPLPVTWTGPWEPLRIMMDITEMETATMADTVDTDAITKE